MSSAQVEKYSAQREIHVVEYLPVVMLAVLYQTLSAVPMMYIAVHKDIHVLQQHASKEQK